MSAPAPLEVRGVTMQFGGLKPLAEFDLVMQPGELVGLIGPNGAGKTTMMRAVLGLVPIECGTIRVLGETDLRRALPRWPLGWPLPPSTVIRWSIRRFASMRKLPSSSVMVVASTPPSASVTVTDACRGRPPELK